MLDFAEDERCIGSPSPESDSVCAPRGAQVLDDSLDIEHFTLTKRDKGAVAQSRSREVEGAD